MPKQVQPVTPARDICPNKCSQSHQHAAMACYMPVCLVNTWLNSCLPGQIVEDNWAKCHKCWAQRPTQRHGTTRRRSPPVRHISRKIVEHPLNVVPCCNTNESKKPNEKPNSRTVLLSFCFFTNREKAMYVPSFKMPPNNVCTFFQDATKQR